MWGSRRKLEGGDDRRLDVLAERLVLKVQFERFSEVGLCLVDAVPLAGHLVPEFECFEACSSAWGFYVNGSLKRLITAGEGEPNAEERATA